MINRNKTKTANLKQEIQTRIQPVALSIGAVFAAALYCSGILQSLPLTQQIDWTFKCWAVMWLMSSGAIAGYVATKNGMDRLHVRFSLLKTLVACALFVYGTVVLLQT